MSPAALERIDPGVNHVDWRVKIRLADLKVDDLLPFCLKRTGTHQNFKGAFSPKPGHPPGQLQFRASNRGSSALCGDVSHTQTVDYSRVFDAHCHGAPS